MTSRESIRDQNKTVNSGIEKPLLRSKWRHRSTGNEYRVESLSHGSGELHGHIIVQYRRTNTDTQLFSRMLVEWHEKMEMIK